MMDFELTEEQCDLRAMVREFAEAEIRPHVMEWDEKQDFPTEVLKKLGRLGVLGVVFPEEAGGAGMGYIEYALIMEELARVDPSIALSVGRTFHWPPDTFTCTAAPSRRASMSPSWPLASGSAAGR